MSNVVQFIRPGAAAPRIQTNPSTDVASTRERMRRTDVLGRMLENARQECMGSDLALVVIDGADGWRAEFETGRRRLPVAGPFASIDDLAGVVRTGLRGWIAAHRRRSAMRIVH